MLTRHLVLGGARSGKSSFAESLVADLAEPNGREQVYVATGSAADDEMADRIGHHQAQRGDEWTLIEESINLTDVLRRATGEQVVLVDCLTLWLTNLYAADRQGRWLEERSGFLTAVEQCPADVVLVSNEVGFGVVPLGAETRWFVDEIGRLHQALGRSCTHVTLVAAGLPLVLKEPV